MIQKDESKDAARRRARKRYEQENNIRLGCHRVISAKIKNADQQRTGKCMTCGELSAECRCDERSAWWKKNVG